MDRPNEKYPSIVWYRLKESSHACSFPKPRANSGDAHGWQGFWLVDRPLRNYAAGLVRVSGNSLNLDDSDDGDAETCVQNGVGRGRERPSETCNAHARSQTRTWGRQNHRKHVPQPVACGLTGLPWYL
jgi:hypothetical protein